MRSSASPLWPEEDPHYVPFLAAGGGAGADVVVDVAEGPIGEQPGGRARLEAGDSWLLWERRGSLVIRDREADPGTAPGWELEVQPGGVAARMTCRPWRRDAAAQQPGMPSPFHYPQDQIVLTLALAGRGAVLHAGGASIGGAGVLFAGASGAGKTTLARLLAAAGHEVLSDDRVVVRRERGEVRLHGTPWPGEGGFAVPGDVPLGAAVFLSKGAENRLRPLAPREIAGRYLPVMSVPWFDGRLAGDYLAFCADLAGCCPVFELTFRPDAGAVEALAGVLG